MRLLAFVSAIEWADMAFYDPFDERVGTKLRTPDMFYLIEHPRGRVLFDTGLHPDASSGDGITVEQRPEDHLVTQLGRVGVKPTDIAYVVQSHLHYDHTGGLAFLRGVPVVVQSEELSFARNPPIYQRLFYRAADLSGETRWNPIHGEMDLFGDGLITLVPTPGHTPGHQAMIVRLPSRTVILAADAHYSAEKMKERRLPAVLWNPDAMVRSWELLERLEADLDGELFVTHELEFERKLPLGDDWWS